MKMSKEGNKMEKFNFNIDIGDQKFNVGDRVKLVECSEFDKEFGLKKGFVGTVVIVLLKGEYVIKFDNWHNGRGEDGTIWWVSDYKLEKVEEQK